MSKPVETSQAAVVLISLFGLIFIDTVALLWAGYVMSKLWLWYLVPLGLPVIGTWTMFGTALIVSVATKQYVPFKGVGGKIAFMFFMPLFALIFGAIGLLFH